MYNVGYGGGGGIITGRRSNVSHALPAVLVSISEGSPRPASNEDRAHPKYTCDPIGEPRVGSFLVLRNYTAASGAPDTWFRVPKARDSRYFLLSNSKRWNGHPGTVSTVMTHQAPSPLLGISIQGKTHNPGELPVGRRGRTRPTEHIPPFDGVSRGQLPARNTGTRKGTGTKAGAVERTRGRARPRRET